MPIELFSAAVPNKPSVILSAAKDLLRGPANALLFQPEHARSLREVWGRQIQSFQRTLRTVAALTLAATLLTPIHAQQPAQEAPTTTIRVQSNLVLTNVVVRDKKTGAPVRDLKASDFTITENGKPQRIASFDFQTVDAAARLNEATISGTTPTIAQMLERSIGGNAAQLRDHRLIVLFFDVASMQPDDIDRAVDGATDYIRNRMAPADLVAVASLGTALSLDHDFTSDKQALLRTVARFNGSTDSSGLAAGNTSTDTTTTADNSNAFQADDTEYNNLNTDRELYAIQTIAKSLERVDQRKSMLYFSGGLSRNGVENQASIRSATNAAARANMAIYTVDARGLQALPPLGDASSASMRGTGAFSGASMQAKLDSNAASQELLSTLASDTGGKFFGDSNDFAPAFQQIQHDTEAYYILGFRSTDSARDGRFRKLSIKLNRTDARLEYRPGYYAPADFQHQKTEDREEALNQQLRSDLPAVDVPVYLEAFFFREQPNLYTVPMALIVPGSAIPFTRAKDQDKATLDIVGQVKNAQGIVVGNARETVRLSVDGTAGAARRNIQYGTSFQLAPGHYHVKYVVRENETGNMGSFETDILVPDQRRSNIKLSSVVVSSQRTPASPQPNRRGPQPPANPLVHDNDQFLPNVPHVFRQDAHLYLLYELYDPAKLSKEAQQQLATEAAAQQSGLKARSGAGGVHVLTSVEFLQNGAKILETPLVSTDVLNEPNRNAVGFTFDVPLTGLKPGDYICQVNVIDDAGGAFTFPRLALRVVAPAIAPSPQPPAQPAQAKGL